MVYVISQAGQPLMPTCRYGKVKHLLKSGKAKVVQRTPFTVQLMYQTTEFVQHVTLGVDAGSKTVGLSASTEQKELYASETILRTDIVGLLSDRRQYRRTRRSRKTRYRAPRFMNRTRSKKKGWLAPSINHKIETHLKLVRNVHKILPISKIVVEVAAFDIQKIKKPDIEGAGYQQGEQLGTWNVREYVLFRDEHQCQHCKGRSKDKVLCTHHIESRKTGGDAPNNLITLCQTCHKLHHQGMIALKVKRGMRFKEAAFMGIMRWAFYNRLKELYGNTILTYGYITKTTHGLNTVCQKHMPLMHFALRVIRKQKEQVAFSLKKRYAGTIAVCTRLRLVKAGYEKRTKPPTRFSGSGYSTRLVIKARVALLWAEG